MIIGFIANLLAYKMSAKKAVWLARGFVALVAIGAIWFAVGAIRNDARNDLLAEQAEGRRIALEAQRAREAAAAATRSKELAAGAKADAAQLEELTNATQNLPDTRPSDRARRRVCVELRQQDRAAGRPPRSC